MDTQIIKTTIPLSASLINEYCNANSENNNNILYEFDISDCPLTPSHILGYLSNLKIDFRVVGFNDDFFREYLTTEFYVGDSNMKYHHANLLSWVANGEILYREVLPELETNYSWFSDENAELVQQHLALINNLPTFLVNSSSIGEDDKKRIVGYDVDAVPDKLQYVGVNIAHLVTFEDVLLRLIGDKIYNFTDNCYYTYYFDEYLYGGDKLIQSFIDHPTNLLNVALDSVLRNV